VARQKGEREREQKTGLVIELLFFWHRFSYRAPIHKERYTACHESQHSPAL
jgi:hypothetical protein